MDGEIPQEIAALDDLDEKVAPKKGKRTTVEPQPWTDALREPTDDPLQFVAETVFRGLAIAYQRTLTAVGMKVEKRIYLLSQLATQLTQAIPKRRLWLAEQAIKGEAADMASMTTGAKLEPRNADDENSGGGVSREASRPTPRRGRPRSR